MEIIINKKLLLFIVFSYFGIFGANGYQSDKFPVEYVENLEDSENSVMCGFEDVNQNQPGFVVERNNGEADCLQCFCMNTNSTCRSSSTMKRSQMEEQLNDIECDSEDYNVNIVNEGHISKITEWKERHGVNVLKNKTTNLLMKFPQYSGNQVTAYGGDAMLLLDNVYPFTRFALHLKGRGLELRRVQELVSCPKISIPLTENQWQLRVRDHYIQASRENLMTVLTNVQQIELAAVIDDNEKEISVIHFSLPYAREDLSSSKSATEVEICDCPIGYDGTSCESCARGYRTAMYSSNNKISLKCQFKVPKPAPRPTPRPAPPSPMKCDRRGTFDLDHGSSGCLCKDGVEGKSCDRCRQGYFDLNIDNEYGCKECWCSGVSSTCKSSSLRRSQIQTMSSSPKRSQIHTGSPLTVGLSYNIRTNLRRHSDYVKPHFRLHKIISGNKLRSYGGLLEFIVTFNSHSNEDISFKPSLVIESFDSRKIKWKLAPNSKFNIPIMFSIHITEDDFEESGGYQMTRKPFLEILRNFNTIAIFVPSNYRSIKSITVRDIVLDTSTSDPSAYGNPVANEVEQCTCPSGYVGLSCETCAAGYRFDNNQKRCLRVN